MTADKSAVDTAKEILEDALLNKNMVCGESKSFIVGALKALRAEPASDTPGDEIGWTPSEHQILSGQARAKNLGYEIPDKIIRSIWRVMWAAMDKAALTPQPPDFAALLKQAQEAEFNPALYNAELDQLEFQTVDKTVISERVNEWFSTLRQNGTDEIVGFQLWSPLAYAKHLVTPQPSQNAVDVSQLHRDLMELLYDDLSFTNKLIVVTKILQFLIEHDLLRTESKT